MEKKLRELISKFLQEQTIIKPNNSDFDSIGNKKDREFWRSFTASEYGESRGDLEGGTWGSTGIADPQARLIELIISNDSWFKQDKFKSDMTRVYLLKDKWVTADKDELPEEAQDVIQGVYLKLSKKIEGYIKSQGGEVKPNEDFGVVYKNNPKSDFSLDLKDAEEIQEYMGTGSSGGNATDGNDITSPRPFADDEDEI